MTATNRTVRGKRPQFHDAQALDEAFSMIMVLAQEVTVLRERLDTFERVVEPKGEIQNRIESFVCDEEGLTEREAWRRNFLASLFYLTRQNADDAHRGQTASSFKAAVADIEAAA